jgi:hypothetical protein
MIINRRNFVQSSACVVPAASGFANLLLLSPSAQTDRSLVAEPMAERNAVVETAGNDVLFKIYGWDCSHTIGIDQLQVDSKAVNDGPTVIRVMQSWRTAWL